MLETLIFALVLNTVGFLVAFKRKTDKLTDISYAVSFAAIGAYNAFTHAQSAAQWAVYVVTTLWAIRLGSFLLYRVSVVGKDSRFDEMRKSFYLFGRFWILQGLTAWVVMIPSSYILRSEQATELTGITVLGLAIALMGLLIESIADWQKFTFNQNPKNKGHWIADGVWKYSRHPNYFGEISMWSGVYIACYPWLTDSQQFYGLVSPLLIATLLIGFSGIPILEKSANARWGKDKAYQEYKRRTSILVPLPNRK